MTARTRLLIPVLFAAIVMVSGCTAAPSPQPEPSPAASAPAASAPAEAFTGVLGSVLGVPQPVPATDGRIHLAYELLLSNVLSQSATVESVTVRGDGHDLLTLSGDDLLPWTMVYGSGMGERVIGAGQQALVWLDVTVDSHTDVPTSLDHVVTISVEQENLPIITSTMVETIAAVALDDVEPIMIGPPLEGDNWLDANSCCVVTPHRAAVNPIDGRLNVPERFGIDYVQLDSEGRIFTGDITDLASYEFYGANILAVGDGPIVSMVTDLPEQVPGANPTGLALAEYGGNNVVQDLGNGHYAFYAHLQADNPLGLSVGQQLKKGDVLGLLGNTGNTDTPHLHFHVMDSPSPLASNGLPFVFDSFELSGIGVSQATLDDAAKGGVFELTTDAAGAREREFPLFLDLMSYPNVTGK